MNTNSLKLRFLTTLAILWKYSDKNHPMNAVKLNKHLKGYGLDCTDKVMKDTAQILRAYGIDLRKNGKTNHGIWIEDRPLSDPELNKLVFAISTNPYLTKEQSTEILQLLKPFVTVYQEDSLNSLIDKEVSIPTNDKLYEVYSVICEAIHKERRIKFTSNHGETANVVSVAEQKTNLFVPKYIYQFENEIYMIGFSNNDQEITAVNLKDIISVQLTPKRPILEQVKELLSDITPADYIPK